MIQRCTNAKHTGFKNYGGRGIAVCEEWRTSYAAFLSDMGRKPSKYHKIDRIDNNLGYSKENCKWVSQKEQCNNMRKTRFAVYEGKTYPVSVLSDLVKVPNRSLHNWINKDRTNNDVTEKITSYLAKHQSTSFCLS